VIESGAILIYLGEKAGRFIPTDPLARLDMMQWLMLQIASVGPMCGQLVHFTRFAPKDTSAYSEARYRSEVNRLFDLYEGRLAASAYVGGADYSLADMAAWPWLRIHDFIGVSMASRPHLARWIATIGERPATKAAMAKLATLKSTRDTASEDDKDRFFGRGRYARA
jgi:GST-like protein